MNLLQFVKRYIVFIVIVAFICWAIGAWYWLNNNNTSVKTTMFLTLATENSNNPEQAEEAATRFGETVIGWFRNPVFVNNILEQTKTQVSLSASKQERQNILISIVSKNNDNTENVSKYIFKKLSNEIERYNIATKSIFVIIDQGKTTSIRKNNFIIYALAWVVLGFVLSLSMMALKEFSKNEVSSKEEVEKILGVKTLDILSREWENNDLTTLSLIIQKSRPIVILAGVDIDIELLSVAAAHKHILFWEKIALADGDLKNRSLQKTMKLETRIKNIKWHTDALLKKEIVSNIELITQNTLHENLIFLPAGKWEFLIAKVFTSLAKKMKTLIHSVLPSNLEILQFEDASLILVIEIGKTNKMNLEKIRQIWKNDIHLIIAE